MNGASPMHFCATQQGDAVPYEPAINQEPTRVNPGRVSRRLHRASRCCIHQQEASLHE